jgi:hypothetical protein
MENLEQIGQEPETPKPLRSRLLFALLTVLLLLYLFPNDNSHERFLSDFTGWDKAYQDLFSHPQNPDYALCKFLKQKLQYYYQFHQKYPTMKEGFTFINNTEWDIFIRTVTNNIPPSYSQGAINADSLKLHIVGPVAYLEKTYQTESFQDRRLGAELAYVYVNKKEIPVELQKQLTDYEAKEFSALNKVTEDVYLYSTDLCNVHRSLDKINSKKKWAIIWPILFWTLLILAIGYVLLHIIYLILSWGKASAIKQKSWRTLVGIFLGSAVWAAYSAAPTLTCYDYSSPPIRPIGVTRLRLNLAVQEADTKELLQKFVDKGVLPQETIDKLMK